MGTGSVLKWPTHMNCMVNWLGSKTEWLHDLTSWLRIRQSTSLRYQGDVILAVLSKYTAPAVMFPTVILRPVSEYHLWWVIHTIIHRSDFNKVDGIGEIKELQQSYITAISLLAGGKQEVMLWLFFLCNILNPLRLIAILILLFTFIITFYEDGQFVKTVVPLRICK